MSVHRRPTTSGGHSHPRPDLRYRTVATDHGPCPHELSIAGLLPSAVAAPRYKIEIGVTCAGAAEPYSSRCRMAIRIAWVAGLTDLVVKR